MIAHNRSRRLDAMLFVVLPDVVAPFFRPIQRHNIPEINFDARRTRAIGDALQLLAVLRFNVRPHHVLRRVAKELPVFIGVMREFEVGHFDRVLNFGGQ